MAQERFWNWKDDDLTFRLNWRDLGIHEAGRYRGFDWTPVAGMSFQFNHAATGVVKTKADYTASPNIGVWLTKQGCMITEDANVTVGTVNPTSSLPRIDLIVGRHQYVYSVGGAFATYAILQGTPNAVPVAPTLPFPNEQVVLGQLYLPPNTTNLNDVGVVFTPAKVPYFANVQLGLSDAYDCEVTNQTAGDILLSFGAEFQNVNGQNWIQNMNIKMNNAFEEKAVIYPTLASAPFVTVAGAGGDGLNVLGVNKFIFDNNSGLGTIAGLPSSYQVGTTLRMQTKYGRTALLSNHYLQVRLNSNIAALSGGTFLPIRTKQTGQIITDLVYCVEGQSYRFERMADHWLMISELQTANNQIMDYKACVVAYFGDIVGIPVGTVIGGFATAEGTLISATVTSIFSNSQDNGYRVVFSQPISYDMVQFLMYSIGTTTTEGDYANDILYPVVQNLSNTGFDFYVRQVAAVVQTGMYMYMNLLKFYSKI